jgi:hypothetical protein
LETILRAAELHGQGLSISEIARELGRSPRTVSRYKRQRPDLFERFEPGSLEHRRVILLRALETGSLSEQLRAAELLDRLSANEKPKGSGRIMVTVVSPETCPHCGNSLREPAESKDRDTARDTIRATPLQS